MRQRDLESVSDSDPHGLLFGSPEDPRDARDDASYDVDPHDDHDLLGGPASAAYEPPSPDRPRPAPRAGSRLEARRSSRRQRRRRVMALLAVVIVVVVAASAWLIGRPIYNYFHPSDYTGSGTGTVLVTVHPNDGAAQIGTTLHKAGVVASQRAFTDAAKDNAKSSGIQPGSYRLHHHMSAKRALTLILDPSSRVNTDVVVPEGATSLDVEKRLTSPACTASSPADAICGLGLTQATVAKAFANVKALGLPTDFTVAGKVPASVEGFLFPATYAFDESTDVTDALQQMVTKFTDQARTTNFTASARALGLTPYQELVVASIAQSEAKFPADMGRVARVILNRIAQHKPLQIDATSAYACKLAGTDPTKCIYAQVQGPYNSYNNAGLPPTPISNPGVEAMNGAAHPEAGNWLYYVNADAAGHLFFTNSETAFAAAAAKCRANNWGCG